MYSKPKTRYDLYFTLSLTIMLILCGCSSGDTYPKAQTGVKTFHDLLDSGNFSKIYSSSGSAFKSATSEAKLNDFLKAVHSKLGRVLNSSETNYNVGWMNGVTSVQLTEDTHFENANATERFIFSDKDGDVLLQGYNIQSDT